MPGLTKDRSETMIESGADPRKILVEACSLAGGLVAFSHRGGGSVPDSSCWLADVLAG
jgi:hypothetical protein